MIEVKNIKKSYGTLQVLKGIDLIIPEKQIVTIVGASGAGKSTLLHIIGTLDYPDEGEVWYEQDNVAHYSANKLANFRNNNIGFVFQFHHLLPEFTALENVCMPAWIKGVPRKEAEKKALGLLELMGLQTGSLINRQNFREENNNGIRRQSPDQFPKSGPSRRTFG